MEDTQLRALIAAIILSTDKLARATVSPHGRLSPVEVTESVALRRASDLIRAAKQ